MVERAAADGRARHGARDRAVPTKLPKAMARMVTKTVAKEAANAMSLPRVAGAVAAGIGEATETLEHYSELCLTPAVESARALLEYLHLFTCAADSFLKRHLCRHVVQKGFFGTGAFRMRAQKENSACAPTVAIVLLAANANFAHV